jgi:hypothetical protein
VFPVLFLIEGFLRGILYSKSAFGLTGGFLFLTSGFWQVLFFLAWFYFTLPNLVGGVVLVVFHELASFRSQRASRWLSVTIGGLVALVGITWFYFDDWAWNIQEEWLFAILIAMWEIAAYAWLGRRLRSRHNPL